MSTYSWSYAPTNRASCKGKCKQKIEKGALRFGTAAEVGDHSMQQYRNFGCVTDKQIENVIEKVGGLDKVDGFDVLTKADQAKIVKRQKEVGGAKAAPAAKAGAAKASARASAAKAAPPVRTPAAKAERKAKVEAVRAKPEPAIKDQHAFLDKAKEYDFDAVKALVEKDPALLNVQPAGRWSALHQFAESGNTEAVEWLLSQGADRTVKNKDGQIPAEVADDACKALLEEDDGEEEEDAGEEEPEAEEEEAPEPAAGSKRKASPPKRGASPPKKKASAPESPPKRSAAAAAESPAKRSKAGGRPVDPAVPGRDAYSVVDDWSVTLNQTNVGANNNKYYKIQVLKDKAGKHFCFTHWGRVGASGQNKLEPCGSQDGAEKEFKSKFKQKTGVPYEDMHTHDWTPVVGKYTRVDIDEQEGAEGGEGAALGKLTPQQIEKGQGVLAKLDAALSAKKQDKTQLDGLSSQYYTLIPHDFGFKVPPAINTREMLEAEEELLKFYLRMGFEELEKADDGKAPIDGIMELELPKTLESACSKLCTAKDIKLSNEKGTMHAAKQSGGPNQAMEAVLYAAIMLYTSNAIYQDLNNVLRGEDRSKIKKYFSYLRLLLEALGRLPQQKKTVWRGISVDLFDQYKKGSTVTWWSVSSCTADVNVAKNFMKGCGGKCTLITVKSKTAADISSITFFGNEKEHLLAPGTQLKVLASKREGNVTEIEMEEVGRGIK